MKSRTVMIGGIVAIAVVALLAVGCQQPFPLKAASEHDRIKLFQDAINGGDYNDIMTCFSSSVSIYNQMNTQSFWDGSQYSHDYASFSITTSTSPTSNGDYSGAMYESETISSHNGGPTGQIQFWLINPTGDNWQIRELQLGSGTSQSSGGSPTVNDIW